MLRAMFRVNSLLRAPMRARLFLAVLLPVLLLVAQQNAMLHELGHAAGSPARTQRQDKQIPPGTACDKCVVFAHLSGAVAPDAPALKQPLLAYEAVSRRTVSLASTEVPTARSRGPPSIL
jgi:hypothetical protein